MIYSITGEFTPIMRFARDTKIYHSLKGVNQMNTKRTQIIDIDEIRITKEIETYIKNTERPENPRYDVSIDMFLKLGEMVYSGKVFDALTLMKRYAQAKGYRQAKAELMQMQKKTI